MDTKKEIKPKVIKRDETFAEKVPTKIWKEIASEDNAYVAKEILCHGYDFNQLIQSYGFFDVLFLLLKGELPSAKQRDLLEKLFLMFCNPGPRHPAVRAAMSAGVSGVDPVHLLPISLSVLGGEYLGASEVKDSIKFIRKNLSKNPSDVAIELMGKNSDYKEKIAPGFGCQFNGADILSKNFAEHLAQEEGADRGLAWGARFSKEIQKYNQGWLRTGVVAAVMVDLGLRPDTGACMYQFASIPGLMAHGLEVVGKNITAMPFVSDENYRYVKDSDGQ